MPLTPTAIATPSLFLKPLSVDGARAIVAGDALRGPAGPGLATP